MWPFKRRRREEELGVSLWKMAWRRFRRKLREREEQYRSGTLEERGLVQSAQSLLGHLRQADTGPLRRSYFRRRARTWG